jgi:hypothetical protein
MVADKIVKFVEGVLSKTKEGKIVWEPTAQESNFIAAIGGEFTMSISGPGELDSIIAHTLMLGIKEKYTLVLRDMHGTITTVTDCDEGIRPDAMRELYEAARWQAVHGGEKINKALEVLAGL